MREKFGLEERAKLPKSAKRAFRGPEAAAASERRRIVRVTAGGGRWPALTRCFGGVRLHSG